LVVWCALATQRRYSDHAWLGSVAAAAMAFLPAESDAEVARDLLIGLYLTAGVLKLNKEYLGTARSAGRVFVAHYLGLLRLPVHRWIVRLTPPAVASTEIITGILLALPGSGPWPLALALAILMHVVFGVSGNFPFSVVAMTLWVISRSPTGAVVSGGPVVWLLATTLAMGSLGLLLGRASTGPRSPALLVKDALQGMGYGFLVGVAVSGRVLPAESRLPAVHWVVGVGFVINFVLVLTGVKLEWSFAMFTSLRPYGRSWLERSQSTTRPRYYALSLPPRIPASLVRSIDPRFIYRVTRPGNMVHEGIAYHLEALARTSGTTFAPRALAFDGRTRRMEPVGGGGRPPRRRFLNFPAVVPCSLDDRYLA
jgi:hypothetical protein